MISTLLRVAAVSLFVAAYIFYLRRLKRRGLRLQRNECMPVVVLRQRIYRVGYILMAVYAVLAVAKVISPAWAGHVLLVRLWLATCFYLLWLMIRCNYLIEVAKQQGGTDPDSN